MRKIVAIVAGVLAVLGVLVQPAAAASPSGAGRGTDLLTNQIVTTVETVGTVSFITWSETDVDTGVITGSFNTAGSGIFLADGTWTGTSTSICSACTVAGRTGDLVLAANVHGSGANGCMPWGGVQKSIYATGGLQGLDLTVNLGPSTSCVSAPYTATYHFGT